ncbi:MAG: TetR family transcriptional regulator [Neisseria animaloris]|uniref:MtrCDE transcriptional repressor n=1 Tax=Neisseria animaloris TaxID=326522 RepID=A0A448U951_9NEIS|nr:TetR family transcriptional regulator [Neisseria animaloris]MDO5072925.1 TetR family transcriptional regulator [Neisseria animaloris]VEJ20371.1 mtrCDE transcriptional repressor [Neisseria animaloris]
MRKTKVEALKTREDLMLAALETFYHKGVARASLNEIAQAAGVTRGALYWHFKNKEDLFDGLFQRLCDEVGSKLEEDVANESGNILESLHASLLNTFERLQRNKIHYKFCSILYLKCEHIEQNQAIIAVIEKYQNMWEQRLTDILTLCIKQKSLPDNLDTATSVIYLQSAIDGLIYQWLIKPERIDLSETAPRLVETLMSNLQHCPSLQYQN